MKNLLLLFLFILLFSPATVIAAAGGSGAGNGGDLVACPPSTGRPALELLDLFELWLFDNVKGDFGAAEVDPVKKVSDILDDMAKVSPMRTDQYRRELDLFFSRVEWVQTDLIDIPDSQHIALPVGCRIQQLAIQNRYGASVRYTIDQRLWNQLDNDNRAALILHELIYGEAIETGHKNSIAARDLFRLVFVGGFNPYNIHRLALDKYLEKVLPNGDVILINPVNDLEGTIACGYRLKNGGEQSRCLESPAPQFRVVISRDKERIHKIYPSVVGDPLPLYIRSTSEFGLPPDFVDFEETGRAKPAHSISFSLDKARVWCKGMRWMSVRFRAGEPFGRNLQHVKCDLSEDPFEKTQLNFFGNWLEILPRDAFEYEEEPGEDLTSMGGILAKSATFSVLGNQVEYSAFHLSWIRDEGKYWELSPVPGQKIQVAGSACELTGDINFYTRAKKDYTQLEGSTCAVTLLGQRLLLASPEFLRASSAPYAGRLIEDKKLKIVKRRGSDGPIYFKGTELVEKGTRVYPSRVNGYFEVW